MVNSILSLDSFIYPTITHKICPNWLYDFIFSQFYVGFSLGAHRGRGRGESVKKNVKMCPYIKLKPEVAVGLRHMCGLLLPSVVISLLAEQ